MIMSLLCGSQSLWNSVKNEMNEFTLTVQFIALSLQKNIRGDCVLQVAQSQSSSCTTHRTMPLIFRVLCVLNMRIAAVVCYFVNRKTAQRMWLLSLSFPSFCSCFLANSSDQRRVFHVRHPWEHANYWCFDNRIILWHAWMIDHTIAVAVIMVICEKLSTSDA